ncbi:D-alanyl-D-alanine carboxypeptidase [Elizabethkingia sp. YR214]|uniref:serine hydrolase domain-containing protein n=1 Tax=Elizabethkingia sp. YR214 TaxID=2135667 RepID=UPI000D30617C|nr:serine hydrolase domain-containing protein [Elizabethkingia sp. YR214]PUB31004.1 D-alanyl-D-alanine carboxypeptidase [Elizabethkingia sp. YR214]
MKRITLLIILLISLKVYSQNINKQRIDSLVSVVENNNQGLGSISVFKNGNELYSRTFGTINVDALSRNPDLKYNIGSVSKMITAALIFKLVDNHKIKLENKLSLYYPAIPNSENITIKNLLEHTSGLKNFIVKNDSIAWLTKKVSEKEIIDEIIHQGIAFQPNEKVLYSNSGYYLLTNIVEKLYKSDYSTILKKEIINPLRLRNFASFNNTNYNNISLSYNYDNGWKKIEDFYFGNVIGVGDIASTMHDTNLFISNLFTNKILSEKSFHKMLPSGEEYFGRGLISVSFGGNQLYGHHGDTYGSHSLVLYDPQNKIAISLVLNGERLSKDDFVFYLLNIIYKNKRKLSERQITKNQANLYAGSYSSAELPFKLKIYYENNFLKAEATDQSAFPLDRIGENKFEYFSAGIILEFKTSEKTMILKQRGQKYKFVKE